MTDKEKIRAEIERRMKKLKDDGNGVVSGTADNMCYSAYSGLLSFIDSLPEEPTPKGYDEAYLNECIAKATESWKGVDVDKYMDEVRGRSPEENGRTLFEEIACPGSFEEFIAGLNPPPKIPEMKKEEIVDAEIVKDIHNLLHIKSGPLPMPSEHKFGDKVKIIIVKEGQR